MEYQRATKSAQKKQSTTPSTSPHQTSLNRARAHPFLEFQRTIGNRAVQDILRSQNEQLDTPIRAFTGSRFGHDFSQIPIHPPTAGAIQAKLSINKADDTYEQEADRISTQVSAMPASTAARGAPRIQRFTGKSNGQVDAAHASVDQALAGPGTPLAPALRQDMEQRFGYDFSHVRVHSGTAAEKSAGDVNAHAYTVGHDIVFGMGRFAPGTHEGRRLIAHELTHVVQQSGADATYPGQEHEQHGLLPIRPRQTTQTSIQRQEDFGLATSQNVSGYVAKWEAYKNDKANQKRSYEDLARYAFGVFNDELQAMGIPIVKKIEFKPINSAANFGAQAWEMAVNSSEYTGRAGPLTIGQLTKRQTTDLVKGIYHEARHAEQHYREAQFLAGQGKSEAEIARELSIPENIAKQAHANPLAAIGPADEATGIYVGEIIESLIGDDPKDISKRTQDYRKEVAEHNQEVQQVQDWFQEEPLADLIYDYSFKIRGALSTIQTEAQKRESGSWDTSKLQPAVESLRRDVIPQFDAEITRVSSQTNRSQVAGFPPMVNQLVDLRHALAELLDLIQEQTNSQALIPAFEMLEMDIRIIPTLLHAAYFQLLTEADAYGQADKVSAAMKRHRTGASPARPGAAPGRSPRSSGSAIPSTSLP
jgi:hypothetical protein